MKASLLVLLILIVFSATTSATDLIYLSTDPAGYNSQIVDDTEGVKVLYVQVVTTTGLSSVSFSAPLPECFADAVYLFDDDVYPFTPVGNSQSGVTIGFAPCLSEPIATFHVLSIYVYSMGLPDGCCWYPILPHPSSASGEVETQDCAGNTVTAWTNPVLVGEGSPPQVASRLPLSGAVDVPLDADLSWQIETCSVGLGVVWADVYFGTSSNPPLVRPMNEDSVFDPGPLEPTTTYYWKLHAYDSDGPPGNNGAETPVWSFTTGSVVPVEVTTWGRIKAMYR